MTKDELIESKNLESEAINAIKKATEPATKLKCIELALNTIKNDDFGRPTPKLTVDEAIAAAEKIYNFITGDQKNI